ncbi:MAG: polyphenol oxidase family protein [Verrucomicrobiota bacterium]
MPVAAPIEQISALSSIPGLKHGFLLRTPGIEVDSPDKNAVLSRLESSHQEARNELGMGDWPLVTSSQIHGNEVFEVTEPKTQFIEGVDGLITNLQAVALGVHVADCGAVWIVDPLNLAVGMVHSGKKGTELGIVPRAISRLQERYGSLAGNLQVSLGPCIRPPAYEIDFAAQIRDQVIGAGVPETQFHDAGICTSSDLSRFYSYRIEKGHTGRMLALVGWEKQS